jgi:hypothetical protein
MTATDRSRRFAFREDLQLRVIGGSAVLNHFDAEYGPAAAPDDDSRPDVEVRFARPVASGRATIRGGHKTARWRVGLGAPTDQPLALSIALEGRPRSFGLSLVQGYFVEPLLSVAAARTGAVLLPAAGIIGDEGATVLMGRSRSGKSSVTVRALADGKPTLGDDQILLDGSGRCSAFPRRLRFYSDLPQTAPAAYARLRAATRFALRARRLVRALTRGYVAPPVRVSAAELGTYAREPFPAARILLVERAAAVERLTSTAADAASAVAFALMLIDEQRARLNDATGAAWALALNDAHESEARTLRAAFEGRIIRHIALPKSWDAVRTIDLLAGLVGEEAGPAASSAR